MNDKTKASRRHVLKAAGLAATLAACGDAVNTIDGSGGAGGAGGTGTGGTATGAGGDADVDWATGGTAVMAGQDYGDPFVEGIGAACTVYLSSTEGPCHAPSVETVDISEGNAGLPMRLELLIVDTSCNPIPNATVEIWHCDTHGVYTGDIDGNNDDFCNGGDSEAAASSAYRGIQTAGSDGRVTFDSLFPGWYGGRATHIHFTVTANGQTSFTSQLFFDEDLKTDVYASQPNYDAPSGQGYQLNATDQVIGESNLSLEEVVVSTQKQADGAMLAWKAIAVA